MLPLTPLAAAILPPHLQQDSLNSACLAVGLCPFHQLLEEASLMTTGLGTSLVTEDCQLKIPLQFQTLLFGLKFYTKENGTLFEVLRISLDPLCKIKNV